MCSTPPLPPLGALHRRESSIIASEPGHPAEALLGLRQGQFYVAGDSDILLSRFSRGREAVFGPSIYEYRFENGKVREKIAFFQKYFCRLHGSCVFCYNTIKYVCKFASRKVRVPQCPLWNESAKIRSFSL